MARSQIKARPKGMGSVWKKQGKFCLTVRSGGKSKTTILRNPDGTPCTTRQQADAAANLSQSALSIESRAALAAFNAESRRLKAVATPLPLANLWSTYLKLPNRTDPSAATLRNYEMVVSTFVSWANTHDVRNVTGVTPGVASDFLADVAGDVGPRRYNEYVGVLKMVFGYLGDYLPDGNPFADFRRKPLETIKHEALLPEQVKRVLQAFDVGFFKETEVERLGVGRERQRVEAVLEWRPKHSEEMRVLCYVLAFTGCRLGDGCRLKWSAIDLAAGTLSFVPSKTRRRVGQKIVLPIHADLRRALADASQWRDGTAKDGYILPNVASRYGTNPTGLSKDISKIISLSIGEEARTRPDGLKRVNAANVYGAHSFRHFFVSQCVLNGVPMPVVQSIVGHTSALMTGHYAHSNAGAKLRAIASLPCLSTPNDETAVKCDLQARMASLVAGATVEQLRNAIALLEN